MLVFWEIIGRAFVKIFKSLVSTGYEYKETQNRQTDIPTKQIGIECEAEQERKIFIAKAMLDSTNAKIGGWAHLKHRDSSSNNHASGDRIFWGVVF